MKDLEKKLKGIEEGINFIRNTWIEPTSEQRTWEGDFDDFMANIIHGEVSCREVKQMFKEIEKGHYLEVFEGVQAFFKKGKVSKIIVENN